MHLLLVVVVYLIQQYSYDCKEKEIYFHILIFLIQTLTYSYPDDNLWEHENGHRVPKHVSVNITYKVLHKQVPNMITQFYGKDLVSNIHYIKDSEREAINGE